MEDTRADELPLKSFIVDIDGNMSVGNILFLERSCYVWIGDQNESSMSSLVVAMNTKYENMPLSTTVFDESGNDSNSIGCSLAQRISKRFNIQCFVSYNLSNARGLSQIESELVKAISENNLEN